MKNNQKTLAVDTTHAYKINVKRMMTMSLNKVWKLITSPKGIKIWLGSVADIKFVKKEKYITKTGIMGEVNLIEKDSHIGLTWQPKEWVKPSLLQISLIPSGNNTIVSFHHESLPSAKARKAMQRRWQNVLRNIQNQ